VQLIDGAPVCSATDLVGFLACEHLTNLERAALAGLVKRPMRADPELDRIAKRGLEHEHRFLAGLREEGRSIVEIAQDDTIEDRGARYRAAAAGTLEAMRSGVDVIYQATFFESARGQLGHGGRPGHEPGQGHEPAPRNEPAPRYEPAPGHEPGAAGSVAAVGWLGFADFLCRVDTPSDLGSWSYEAWDTKLARHVKASALLQLCLYTDLLERLQGTRPAEMHVALGGSAHAVEHFRTADYLAYYRLVRGRFEAFVGTDDAAGDGDAAATAAAGAASAALGVASAAATAALGVASAAATAAAREGPAHPVPSAANAPVYPPLTRPEPVEHCDVCRWVVECKAWRREHDDLSLVAGITTRQRRALREHEPPVDTRRTLAATPIPLEPPLARTSGVREEGLRTVREQARIQVEGEDAGRILYELLPPARLPDGTLEPDRGLLSLPEPSPGDLFFDIEGDPFALEDGVDYLFGVIEPGPAEGAPDPGDVDSGLRAMIPEGAGRPGLPATGLPRRPDGLPPATATGVRFEQLRAFDAPGSTTGSAGPHASTPGSGTDAPTFHATWALDADGQVTPAAEKHAFEELVDLIVDRRNRDPGMHVYHYAAYEPTAMGRLSERYHTREDDVDALLRGGVFVDLFRAVRQGIRASVESYSIKKLEPLYGFRRERDLRDAGTSIVEFETWLELGPDEAASGPQILADIEGYNRDDCVSTLRLRDWLEARRPELAAREGLPTDGLPRPTAETDEPGEKLSDYLARVRAVEESLVAGLSPEQLADAGLRSPEEQARWLLAQLLEWHRREDKSAWWRFFHLMRLTDEELIRESDAMGGLTLAGEPRPDKRSLVYRYRFPEQEHDITPGTDVFDPVTGDSPGEVVDVNNVEGWLELKRGPTKQELPHPRSLVPRDVVGTPEQRESLLRVGASVAENGIDADGDYRAAWDILLCRPPRFVVDPSAGRESQPRGAAPSALRLPGEHGAAALRRIAPLLDHSYLAVQGPPGSGKTTAGAELIVDLVGRGCRVGVTANSHKVIGNLLDKVAEKAKERGVPVRIGQKPGTQADPTCTHARRLDKPEDVRDALANHEIDVAGATGWAWARADMAGSLDLLVVDEAGQVSLANLVAIAPAADSLVLLGDPQQLDQPLKGSHPPGAERSALGHLLGGAKTMPEHLGLLLESTWRLHPDICAYTSEVFYDGRLHAGEGTGRQALAGPGLLRGTGIRWVPVDHTGNRNASAEEASLISDLLADLRAHGGDFTDVHGDLHPLSTRDALVITPYNAQVREIARQAPPDARVGTVDKFQGQEAAISIYSMATSSADEAPRGMEFLYSLNRLNVASSRARCLALVVASPELIRVQCRTPRQMRLANALARLVEVGEKRQWAAGTELRSTT
jgi:predicted RecB family nuclease